jgi:hypothetical protein
VISLTSHFSPLHSCIHPSHPANEELGRLLRLLVLCNKYGIREFEEHVLTLVKPLSHPDRLPSNLKADLTATEVIRVAILVNQPEIAEGARKILRDEVWGDRTKVPAAIARLPYETLLYAESIGDKDLIGAAYYRLLISGDKAGSTCTPSLRQTLDRGMIRCGEEWQKIFDSWGRGKSAAGGPLLYCEYCGHSLSGQERFMSRIWSLIAEASTPWYDVAGKVRCAMRLEGDPYPCCSRAVGPATRELARIKKEAYSYFMEEKK